MELKLKMENLSDIIKETIANLLSAEFTAENEGGATLFKFNGETIFYLDN